MEESLNSGSECTKFSAEIMKLKQLQQGVFLPASSAAPHVLVATAAVAVGQVLAAVDGPVRGGRPPASWGAVLEVDADAATVVTRPGFRRPGCSCGTAAAAVPDSAPGPTAPCGNPPAGWTITV